MELGRRYLALDVPPTNNAVVGDKSSGHGRRCIIVLTCHDVSKGLLSILLLNKKHEKERENSL